jgi:hypothetical protein
MLQYQTNAGVRSKLAIGKSGDLTVEQARKIAQDWLLPYSIAANLSFDARSATSTRTPKKVLVKAAGLLTSMLDLAACCRCKIAAAWTRMAGARLGAWGAGRRRPSGHQIRRLENLTAATPAPMALSRKAAPLGA